MGTFFRLYVKNYFLTYSYNTKMVKISSDVLNKYKARQSKYLNPSKEIMKVQKQVKKLTVNNPVNYRYFTAYNSTLSTGLINSTPITQLLNGFATGTDEETRTGDKGRHIRSDILVQVSATASLTSETKYRVVVVKESSCLGSAVSLNQVFTSATPSVMAIRNFTTRNASRYTIYYDRIFSLGPTAAATGNLSASPWRVHKIKLTKKFITDYSRGVAGTVNDIDTGSLYLCVFTDCPTASAVNVNYSLVSKWVF